MILEYLGIKWRIEASETCKNFFLPLLKDYFLETDRTDGELDFEISLIEGKYSNISEIMEFGKEIVIHNSKKPDVHEMGVCYKNGFITFIYNKSTKSVYKLNHLSKHIKVYNEDIFCLSKDCIRITRDIVKVLVESKQEAILLHAAALRSPKGQGILLIGGKKSGKTTISLDLLFNHGFEEISRDRTFLVKNHDRFIVWGWPNYYNLTMDTIKKFERIEHLIPEKYSGLDQCKLERLQEKRQFLPDQLMIHVKGRCCKLDFMFFLVENSQDDYWESLAPNLYTPFDLNYPNWHKWVPNHDESAFSRACMLARSLSYACKVEFIPREETVRKRIEKIIQYLEEA